MVNQIAKLPRELTFDTVGEIRTLGMKLIATESVQTFDLVNVHQSDSAGLALLIDLLRFARLQNKSLRFINIPAHLQAFARVNGVDTFLF